MNFVSLKKKKDDCRFNIPHPILDKTMILLPLNKSCNTEHASFLKNIFKQIKSELNNIKNEDTSLKEFLQKLHIKEG